MGIGIDVGPRFETRAEHGLSALLKRMLVASSTAHKSGQEVSAELEAIGASVIRSDKTCKDSIYVAAEVLRPHVRDFLKILRESAESPFSQDDLDFQKQSLAFEHEDHMMDPDAFVPDLFMETALKCSLALPTIPDPASINAISLERLRAFRDRHLVGSSVVVAGTSVEHAELVQYAKDMFGNLPTGTRRPSFPLKYEGGSLFKVEDDKVAERERSVTGEESTRIQLGFRAPALVDSDFYAVSVLMSLMGGGSSFSSGGPGKGMYTRLYTRVLNRWRFVQEAKCFLHMYEDISLFGFACKTDPDASVNMLEVMCSELIYMATDISDEEFSRAKNKLKSDMFMDLESRIVQMDDLVRQVLMWNKRLSAADHAKAIDALSKEQVIRAARKIVAGTPTLVAYGPSNSVKSLPSSHRVQQLLNSNLPK